MQMPWEGGCDSEILNQELKIWNLVFTKYEILQSVKNKGIQLWNSKHGIVKPEV